MKADFARSARPHLFLIALLSALIPSACARGHAPVSGPPADAQSVGPQGVVLREAPRAPDVRAKHLFYLHGKIIEDKGIRPEDPRYGIYEYEQILDTFKRLGFTVISEPRPKDTDVNQYASRTAAQIQELLKAGVPPRLITVVGASKGSVIAMLTSTLLRNRDVNFVLMSNCNDWVATNFKIDLYGNVLSIYDVNDEFGQTCRKLFDQSTGLNRHKEVELKIGTGHAILYKPLKEWVDLVAEWAAEAAG